MEYIHIISYHHHEFYLNHYSILIKWFLKMGIPHKTLDSNTKCGHP